MPLFKNKPTFILLLAVMFFFAGNTNAQEAEKISGSLMGQGIETFRLLDNTFDNPGLINLYIPFYLQHNFRKDINADFWDKPFDMKEIMQVNRYRKGKNQAPAYTSYLNNYRRTGPENAGDKKRGRKISYAEELAVGLGAEFIQGALINCLTR